MTSGSDTDGVSPRGQVWATRSDEAEGSLAISLVRDRCYRVRVLQPRRSGGNGEAAGTEIGHGGTRVAPWHKGSLTGLLSGCERTVNPV